MNMKKKYIIPKATVVEMEADSLLSDSQNGWNPEYQTGFNNDPGTDEDFD